MIFQNLIIFFHPTIGPHWSRHDVKNDGSFIKIEQFFAKRSQLWCYPVCEACDLTNGILTRTSIFLKFIYKLKADRPLLRDYPQTPTYRHTDKHLRLVMTLIALCCTRQSRAPNIDLISTACQRIDLNLWPWPWHLTLTPTFYHDLKAR